MAQSKTWSDQLGTIKIPALGFVELSSISRGLFLTDVVVKKASVRIIASQPVSSGKHVLLYFGDVGSVEEAHRAALENADQSVVRQILIPAVHENLVPFLESIWGTGKCSPMTSDSKTLDSVGIVESLTLTGAVLAADVALKTANVLLCRMRLGQGIGGKAYFVISGKQEAIEAALEAATSSLKELESFCRVDFVARPQEEALIYF